MNRQPRAPLPYAARLIGVVIRVWGKTSYNTSIYMCLEVICTNEQGTAKQYEEIITVSRYYIRTYDEAPGPAS